MNKMMKTIPSIVIMESKLLTMRDTKSITKRTIVVIGRMKLHTRHTILVTGDTKGFHYTRLITEKKIVLMDLMKELHGSIQHM